MINASTVLIVANLACFLANGVTYTWHRGKLRLSAGRLETSPGYGSHTRPHAPHCRRMASGINRPATRDRVTLLVTLVLSGLTVAVFVVSSMVTGFAGP